MVWSLRLSIIHMVQSLIESPLSSLVWGSSRSCVRCIVPFFNGKSSYNAICLEDCLGYIRLKDVYGFIEEILIQAHVSLVIKPSP